ncbi:hypothetical protein U1Q18_023844, partial [Sarracenia purpurea var. burkii]
EKSFLLMGIASHVIPELLHNYSKSRALRHGLSLLAAVVKTGMQAVVIVFDHIVNMYAKCGINTFAPQDVRLNV